MYQKKSLSDQQQRVANRATIGIRICQLISIATLSGLITSWLLGQFGVEQATQTYYIALFIGIMLGGALAVMLENQIEENTELIALFLNEQRQTAMKSPAFWLALFVVCGFLAVSVGGSYAGRHDLAQQANKVKTQDIAPLATSILASTQDTSHHAINKDREAAISKINARYDDLVKKSKQSAYRAKQQARLKDAEWLAVGKVAQLERQRQKALEKTQREYHNSFQTVMASISHNKSKALDVIDKMQAETAAANQAAHDRAEQNIKRHKGIMSKAIFISAPLTLLLIFLRVTVLSGKAPVQKGRSGNHQKNTNTPQHNNNTQQSQQPQPTQQQQPPATPVPVNTSVTGLSREEYRNLRKLARNNYRNGILRGSLAAQATADGYIQELKRYGYETIKGKRYDAQLARVIDDPKGILVDDFETPSLI